MSEAALTIGPLSEHSLTIGIDIGTTSTEGILIDTAGRTLARARREATLHSDHANWAEEDPAEWWQNVCQIMPELLAAAAGRPIAAIGVTGMVPALILLDEAGTPLRRSIQQNDARTTAEIAELQAEVDAAWFFRRTGGSINQQLVAPKLRWLARHEPGVLERTHTILGAYDYIAYRLCGARNVEANWALESGLYDLAERRFTAELAALGGIGLDKLPPIRQPADIVGVVTHEAAAATGLAVGTPVVAGCADHVASAFVANVVGEGDLLIKFGGAGDILLATAEPRPEPRLFLDHHIVPGLWLTNGCMAASGSVLKWIALELFAGADDFRALDLAAGAVGPGAGGIVVLPYFLGEKTPLHDPHARGTILGLGLHHTRAHLWRAALEAVCYGFRHHLEVFADMGTPVRRIVASDGGAASDVWLQIAADVLNREVTRIDHHPGSCLGAAFVAAIGVGAIMDYGRIADFVSPGRAFRPDPAAVAVHDRAYGLYRGSYERLRDLYPDLAGIA